MDKLIFKGKRYELTETKAPLFTLFDEKYEDMEIVPDSGSGYTYRAIRIGGKFYSFKLLKESDSPYSASFREINKGFNPDKLLKLKPKK